MTLNIRSAFLYLSRAEIRHGPPPWFSKYVLERVPPSFSFCCAGDGTRGLAHATKVLDY